MVTAVSATTTTADGAAAMKKATGMNKDDFLKLFVTQLQHQDPLNPQDGNQFIAQLAQLSQVEQAYNTNTNLQGLLTAQNNATVVSAVSFIGKEVLAAGSQVALTTGSPSTLNFRLSEPASSLNIDIRDAAGNLVRTLTSGQTAAGDGSITWDGRDGGAGRRTADCAATCGRPVPMARSGRWTRPRPASANAPNGLGGLARVVRGATVPVCYCANRLNRDACCR